MKKYILAVVFLAVMLFHTPATLADLQAVPQTAILSNKEIVESLVEKYSSEYNVSGKTMMKIIDCEDGDYIFTQQSEWTYKKGNRWGFTAGTREQSFGLVQIHLPDNPITYAQAVNPSFAVEFLAKNLAAGKGNMWSCYRAI